MEFEPVGVCWHVAQMNWLEIDYAAVAVDYVAAVAAVVAVVDEKLPAGSNHHCHCSQYCSAHRHCHFSPRERRGQFHFWGKKYLAQDPKISPTIVPRDGWPIFQYLLDMAGVARWAPPTATTTTVARVAVAE